MSTYYIGADVHSNSTELAIEKRLANSRSEGISG